MRHLPPRRRLFAHRRGAVFVEYSSLILLLVIAAIAVLVQTGGIDRPPLAADKAVSSD